MRSTSTRTAIHEPVPRVAHLGVDGTYLQTVKTDSDGHLQVDVLSGGSAGLSKRRMPRRPPTPSARLLSWSARTCLRQSRTPTATSRQRGTNYGRLRPGVNSSGAFVDTLAAGRIHRGCGFRL
jgi:hypothetical protein